MDPNESSQRLRRFVLELLPPSPVHSAGSYSTDRKNHMSYSYVSIISLTDVAGFAEAGNTWAPEHYRALGATTTTASQAIMGGDMAGMVAVSFEFDSIDAAMRGQQAFYGDERLVQLMQDHQVHIQRRSLMRIQAEFGERTGEFGSVLYMTSAPIDDATAQTNFGHNWGHIQHGANGMMAMTAVAAGAAPFTGSVVTSTDSLDDLMAASVKNFSDPAVAQMMADTQTQVLGRVLVQRLF